MDDAVAEVQELGKKMTRRISIGTTIYCSEILLPALKKFRERYPFIVPEIYEGNSSQLMHLLKNHTIDLAVAARPYRDEGFRTKELPLDSCVLVVSNDFEWEKEYITLDEISRIPLLLLHTANENSLYKRIMNKFEERGLRINLACDCRDSGLLLKMVLNKFGATILPVSMLTDLIHESVRIIPIEGNPWTINPILPGAHYKRPSYEEAMLAETGCQ